MANRYQRQRDALVRALFRPQETVLLDQSPVPAAAFMLRQNYPNPFNSVTLFEYQLAVDSKVELAVYDIAGQKVARLAPLRMACGRSGQRGIFLPAHCRCFHPDEEMRAIEVAAAL